VAKVAVVAGAGLILFFAFMIFLGALVADQQPGMGGTAQGLPGVVCAPAGGGPGQPVAGFANDQLQNAALIVAAGDEMSIPQRGQVIAVATAMQESGLRNLTYGDLDSLGLFQQRASWGPVAVREDPKAAAHLFYSHLIAIPGWQTLPLTVAAQAVQRSALPDAYTRWEAAADQVVGAALHITCQPAGGGGPTPGGVPGAPADPLAQQVIARAAAQIGAPYAWGGGSPTGPTHGISDGGVGDRHGDPGKVGFDCSGLMVYAFAGIGITVPHQTQAIWSAFQPPITDRGQIRPGDMILLSSNGQPSGIEHVGLYLGNGQVLDAPESGLNVRIEPNIWAPGSNWNTHFIGAVRPTATKQANARA
jgi:cell wall-associated NlpC family hydrolase